VAERNFITPYKIRNKTATIHPKIGGYVNVSSGNIRVRGNYDDTTIKEKQTLKYKIWHYLQLTHKSQRRFLNF
jgi:hypothetical protein